MKDYNILTKQDKILTKKLSLELVSFSLCFWYLRSICALSDYPPQCALHFVQSCNFAAKAALISSSLKSSSWSGAQWTVQIKAGSMSKFVSPKGLFLHWQGPIDSRLPTSSGTCSCNCQEPQLEELPFFVLAVRVLCRQYSYKRSSPGVCLCCENMSIV